MNGYCLLTGVNINRATCPIGDLVSRFGMLINTDSQVTLAPNVINLDHEGFFLSLDHFTFL